jgi:Ca-activated chloride channel family protein
MSLAHPWLLVLLLAVPAILWLESRRRPQAAFGFPDALPLARLRRGSRVRLHQLVAGLELVALGLTVIILARPRDEIREQVRLTEGVDMMLALDISRSMELDDFKPNRLAVAKRVAQEFVAGRKGDRIGLVVFAAQSFTQCPLTLDYAVLADLIEQVDFGMVEDGTAIGMAIATAANRLKDSPATSKVLILLTDGVNNAGRVDPLTAAEMAAALGIKVYAIGAGSDQPIRGARRLVQGPHLDEDTLKEIAARTGGSFFRARDPDALRKIYERIAELETTEIETEEFVRYDEAGPILLLPALVLLIVVVVMEHSYLLKIP